jgi:hypothetical protein
LFAPSVSGGKEECMNRWMDKQTDIQSMHKRTDMGDSWTDRHMDGWIDRKNKRLDRRTECQSEQRDSQEDR